MKLHWENGDSFKWEDPTDSTYKQLSELTTLGQLLKKGGKITNEDMVMDGNDYAITLNIKASKAALKANANVELKCSLGDAANHELYAASQTIAKWEHSADFDEKVKNIKEMSVKITEGDKLLTSLNHEKDIATKDQTKKELGDIITPLEELKALGEINGANFADAIHHVTDILLETGDFACKSKGVSSVNVNYEAVQAMIAIAKNTLKFDMDVTFPAEKFRDKNHKCLDTQLALS